MRIKHFWITLLTGLLLMEYSFAFQPTQQQIEQFKKMPPAEQRALAASMGVNASDIQAVLGAEGSAPAPSALREEVSSKRSAPGTKNSTELESIAASSNDTLSLAEDTSPQTSGEKLQLFGYDIFDLGADSFSPALDIPIPSNYVLGPGDTLIIQLYGKENSTYSLELNREGTIQFPDIGPVTLAGLDFNQAQNKINEIVSQQMIGVKSSLSMGALRTIRIFVLGEVRIPGSYVVGSLSTMTNALFASGGVSKIGSLRNIQLKRRGKIITTLDLYDLLLQGDTSNDARLLPGDVIFIPPIGKTIGVSGEVKRPSIYETKNEKTVDQILKLTGGLLPTAYLPASRIERITKAGEKTLVNLDISTAEGRNFKINDADVIQISSTLDTLKDVVILGGHVKRPNGFAWKRGLRFTDIVHTVDDMLPNPDIEIGLIAREEKHTRKIYIHIFSPRKAFANPGGPDDILLSSRDTITLFDYTSDRSTILSGLVTKLKTQASFTEREQVVEIAGSVRFPGAYPLSANMTTRDLIRLAGGLTESAQGSNGEITRYEIDANRETLVMHININLANENPTLVAADTLRVKQVPMWQTKEFVELTGEVINPGIYSILPGETMMDVLHRAGGLTPHAYPEGSVFSRESLRALETERLADIKAQIQSDIAAATIQDSVVNNKAVNSSETDTIMRNIEGVRPLGRMVIDLPAIMKQPQTLDFQLMDGDTLDVPRYKPSVTVVGEVQYPTSHFFDKKLSVEDYVGRSGGTKQNADKRRIYIVKANGRVLLPSKSAWFRSKNKSIEPGDTIIVPLDTDRVDTITMWGSVTSIMYQAALGVAAINTL